MKHITAALIACTVFLPTAWAADAACPPVSAFNPSMQVLEGYRVFTGKNGDSEVAPYRLDIRKIPLFKTGKTLGIFDLPAAPKRGVQIVVGPPDLDLPMHKAPYKEMFILLAGSTTIETKSFKAELKPGSVLLFEDTDATIGHGGHTGPCGYISVSIAP